MAERAVELCLLPDEPCLILDIGCGVGISGELLMDLGHFWIGIDISPSMLGNFVFWFGHLINLIESLVLLLQK